MTPRILALDLGNVLVDYRPERTMGALAGASGLSVEAAESVAAALGAGLKGTFERGILSPRGFLTRLNEAILAAGGRPLRRDVFERGWTAALSPRPAASALVARVPRTVPRALWSNTDPIHFQHIAPQLPILSGFRSLHLSFLAGETKPGRAFFEGALRGLGARAEDVAFADDLPANVEAARACGVDAFVARTVEELEAGLEERGFLDGGDPKLRSR